MLSVGALDLAVGLSLGFVCESVEIASGGLMLALYAIHSAIAFVLLLRLLAPLRAWQRSEHETDPGVVDRALRGAYPPFAAVYTGGVVVAFVAALALANAGVMEGIRLGEAELLYATMLTLALALALPVLLRPLFDSALLDLRLALGRTERAGGGPPRRVGHKVLVLNLGMLAAVMISMLGSALLSEFRGVRAKRLAELRGRVAVTAAELRGGLRAIDELGSELELVGPGQLPPALERAVPDADEILVTADLDAHELLAAAPINGQRWVLARESVEQPTIILALLILVVMATALVPAALGNLALNRSLKLSFAQLDDMTRRIVEEGKLHELARVVPLGDDELGALALNFNRMLDVLDELAAAAASVADGDLRIELEGPGDLQDAFRGMLARLNDVVVQIRGTSLELASAAAEIQATTQEQEDAVDQQSQRVLVVSDAVASLAQSAEDISKTATEVLDNAERALTTTDAMVERITALGAASGSISELLEVIRDIASRSDLLALNGSLEATRAGEAGRGFALVAAEMRRLAERVGSTVADVRERIEEIEAAGNSTVMATEDSRKLADSTAAAARRISEVTLHQSQETEQVSLKVFEVAEVMISAVDATRQTHSAAEGLRGQAAELERLIRQFKLREFEPRSPAAPDETGVE